MPLHGKIVVIKRSGGDGTEFPLTASCLFGRKTDCDIRIQLPQVSKEHCRIDLNENKEVVVTNLSSANPTCINGEALQQSERLKHGDVITIIDRSFRFEFPPAPTPKKRSSIGGKAETFKVLQDHQVGSTATAETVEKRISEVSTGPHLKDGTNHGNIQRSLEKTMELESKEDGSLPQSKTASPFNDLYQMIKKSLDVKTPRKSSASQLQTPSSKFCTPKPQSVRKNYGTPVVSTGCKSTPKRDAAKISPKAAEAKKAESPSSGTPRSVKKQRKSLQVPTTEMGAPDVEEAKQFEPTSPQTRHQATPQKFTVSEVIEQISSQTPKSPMRRRSKDATPAKPAVNKEQEEATAAPKTVHIRKATPKSSEKVKEMPKKRKSGEPAKDLPTQQMKKKRVSFGGYLSPELFDKRLPPDSPLRKGANPRRSLCLPRPRESLLRRASVIGLLKFDQDQAMNGPNAKSPAKKRTPSPKKSSSAKNASPKTPTSGKKSPKSRSPSPKAPSPGKKSATPRAASPKTASPKAPSPGKKTPAPKATSPKALSPGKKTPAPKATSPKALSPGKKTPAPKATSPKALSPGKKTPAPKATSPKAPSPGKKIPTPKTASPKAPSPASKTASPKMQHKSTTSTEKRRSSPNLKTPTAHVTPLKTPLNAGVQTPRVQGRFSVSHISTPSPIAEDVTDLVPSITVTPKIPLRRKSMKSTSKKTPGLAKSAVKVMRRRSGISRVSMKAMNSWADIVKFGQTKVQGAAPAIKAVTKKTKKTDVKKVVSKPKTPARRLKDHVSTGHADSPASIVVGRAHKQRVVHPTGAAPRVVINTALSRKNMKMDEDLTGISEMFKTPVNERKIKPINSDNSILKTPVVDLSRSIVEPSMLNTPEEPGQMLVSPLTESTVKGTKYNSEAVQRLLNGDEEASFVGDIPPLEILSGDSSEQQSTDVETNAPTTPNQKLELPECLTGVKRIMKTPKQKAEPVEDLRGKLLKTPKQKPEQQECLTGVKRMMRTPRQKTEPVEDIRGKLLKTPKQKPEQQECLSGVKQIFKTPRWEDEPLEEGKLDDAKELLETPKYIQESEDLSDVSAKETPHVESSPSVLLSGIKRMMKTPKEKSAPVEDKVGKRLVKTPREKNMPVEENFGIKRLMKSPRLRGVAPVEDFEGLQELMSSPAGQEKTVEVEEQTALDCSSAIAKELDFAHGDSQDSVDTGKEVDANEAIDDQSEEVHVETGLSDAMDTVSESAVDEALSKDQPEVVIDASEVVPSGSEENRTDTMETVTQVSAAESLPEVEMATCKVTETEEADIIPDAQKKCVRGKRAKVVESRAADDEQEAGQPEEPVVSAPVRGRRGKKTEAPAPPAVRQTTRGRNAKTTERKDDEHTQQESAPVPAVKPKRGRNAKKVSDVQAETVEEVPAETETVPDTENEQSSPVNADHEANDVAAPLEKPVVKRRRKATQLSVPQADVVKDACEVVLTGGEENTTDAVETPEEAVVIPDAPKKSVRGRRAKVVESKAADNKQEAEKAEEPVAPAPVRGRRGKKTEGPAPPAVRQTTRGRNVKAQESPSDDQTEKVSEEAVETQMVTDIAEDAGAQTSTINASHVDDASAPFAEEATLKPKRGRKTKQTLVEAPQPEPESTEVSDQHVMEDAQPEQPASTVEKPKRGRRKTKTDSGKQNEVTEDTVVPEEAKQVSQPPTRAKRGRNAKQEEEKLENNEPTLPVETTKSHEPAKKLRRTRKAEQGPEEPREEFQTAETATPEDMAAPIIAEPVKTNEKATLVPKPRRGTRKAQDPESVPPVESTEVQEVPVVSSTDKPKRGRRGKQAAEDVRVTAAVPEEKPKHDPETEEKSDSARAVNKPSRARGVKTSAKNELSEAVPAKRARRGAAVSVEESSAEATDVVPEPASIPVEPVKKGRRAATKAAESAKEAVSSVQVNSVKGVSNAVEDKKKSKRSVKWKADCEVFEVTPLKAVRGRKLKSGDQKDTESNTVSKGATKTEEKDLSDKESQPVKRARRGAKVADVADESTNKLPGGRKVISKKDVDDAQAVEAETQPKTRRGRSAKK